MSVLAVVTNLDQIRPILSWAQSLAKMKEQSLTVLCWTYSLRPEYPLMAGEQVSAENDSLVVATEQFFHQISAEKVGEIDPGTVTIRRVIHPDLTSATIDEIRAANHDLVIAAGSERTDAEHNEFASEPLFRRSPCETILLYRAREVESGKSPVLVTATNSLHDHAAFELFGSMGKHANLKVILSLLEDETGAEAEELGRRELKQIMRDAGVKSKGDIHKRRVYTRDDLPRYMTAAQESQLIVLGSGRMSLVRQLLVETTEPTIAVLHRSPPLRRLHGKAASKWQSKLSPADYADLMQGLRRGAELSTDYLIMLGLAAGIASLGLIQDSPAVVIGSMLLAPLMTPMVACGLAIAQANKKLGRRSMLAIGVGFLMTVVISFCLGRLTPGNEITQQIVARGSPTILDLLVALFSSVAAAYALARPSIIGALAGVAIATALVPPLCSSGISLAYGEYWNAQGAALLFVTNLVAIVLGAAVTFRFLGVSIGDAGAAQRQWVYRTITGIFITLIILAFPLQRGLERLIDHGKLKPTSYPTTKALDNALVEFIERTPEVELVVSGRPSALYDRADVVIILSSPAPLPRSFADALTQICRDEMGDPELVVEVHCFLDAWKETED